MNIGYVQFAPAFCDLEATLARLAELLPQCAGADLIVLPELCNSGYRFLSYDQAAGSAETIAHSRFLTFLTEHCRQYRCQIVSGFNERSGESLFNSAVLVGAEGVLGCYRKLHLFQDEKDYFQPGDLGLPVFSCGPARIGLLVCFDWFFPEVWRVLALRGAEIICHPSNLVLPGLAQRALPIHALINRVFTVTANRVGSESDLTFTGRSLIADARGNVLSEGPATGSHVSVVSIDLALARDKRITSRNHMFEDRRPAEYALLTQGVAGAERRPDTGATVRG